MKQLLILVFALLVFGTVFSQDSTNEIVTEGYAKTKISPDVAIFTFIINKEDTSERKAILKLNTAIEVIEKILNKSGFSNNTVKIADFSITGSTNYQTNTKVYTARNTLKVEFLLNTKVIASVYGQLQQSNIQDVDVDFKTKLSDSLEVATKEKLVQYAINNANKNAIDIAKALNVKLGAVKQIQKLNTGPVLYYSSEANQKPDRVYKADNFDYKTAFDKFPIEEVELEERISIIYHIAR